MPAAMLPSMAGPCGTPSAARIVGARSTRPAPSPRNGRFMKSTPGTRRRVDDVIAAPLLDVVLEDAPPGCRRAPVAQDDAVAGGEVDHQIGRLVGVRRRRRSRSRDARCDRDTAAPADRQPAQARGDRRSEARGVVGSTMPCAFATLQVEVDAAEAERVGLGPRPVDAAAGNRPPPRPGRTPALSARKPCSWSQVFRCTPRWKLFEPVIAQHDDERLVVGALQNAGRRSASHDAVVVLDRSAPGRAPRHRRGWPDDPARGSARTCAAPGRACRTGRRRRPSLDGPARDAIIALALAHDAVALGQIRRLVEPAIVQPAVVLHHPGRVERADLPRPARPRTPAGALIGNSGERGRNSPATRRARTPAPAGRGRTAPFRAPTGAVRS